MWTTGRENYLVVFFCVTCMACLGCGAPVAPPSSTSGPAGIPAAGNPPAEWTAIPDPSAEDLTFRPGQTWQTTVPDSSDMYLPRNAGPTVVVWDAASKQAKSIDLRDGATRGTVSIPGPLDASIKSVDVSADGMYLAAADVSRKKPAVRLWSFAKNEEKLLKLESPEVGVVRFIPRNRLLVARQSLPDVKKIYISVWNTENQDQLYDFPIEIDSLDQLNDEGVAISPGGKYVVVFCGTTLFVCELETGKPCGQILLDIRPGVGSARCRGIAFSPDGTQLAALSTAADETCLCRWDFGTGAMLGKLLVPLSLASLNRNRLATCPDLQWTPSGWLVCGQAFTNGTGIGVSVANLHPQQHRLNEELALFLDTSLPGQRPATLEVGSPRTIQVASGRTGPAAAASSPKSVTWTVTPDPAASPDIADNQRVELPDSNSS